ncbi:MAG: hypothetical protein EOO71_16645 [Myxococcaceae bacterium]|nr:MAG: hypothetical protein EOO71_16645 [Myxococcaceae bacterium]
MKVLWCWRCQQDLPMLDEAEFAEVARLYSGGFRTTPGQQSINGGFAPVTLAYERMTGYVGCHHNAVMHHRISMYGPPCTTCGKPLRTPQARHCAACGSTR